MYIYYTKKGKFETKEWQDIPTKELISTEKLPSIIWPNGNKEWYVNNKHHRMTGPAIVIVNSHIAWKKNGKLHRLDGPAVIGIRGNKEWYQNGKLHRIDGPAIIIEHSGKWLIKKWLVHNKLHREDGPAVSYATGAKEWWINGKLHRLDGPAILSNTRGYIWAINGKKINAKEVNQWIKKYNIDLKTKVHQALFMLRFG